jgi:predicted peptidase
MFLALAVWAVASALPLWARRPDTGFLNRTVAVDGVTYKYQVFVPSNWSKKIKWPVILYLHGYGEEGDDGILQTDPGLPKVIRRHVDRFPFVVVIPQCRKKDWWTSPAMEAQALKALEQTMKEFQGDPPRVYLTGLSMGGYGTWGIASEHPGKFAAIVPICGGIHSFHGRKVPNYRDVDDSADPYAVTAQKLGKTPEWVFHGDADEVIPVTESRKMVEALKAAGGNVRYTEYPGMKHNSYDKAYNEPELFPWLLAQKMSLVK